MGAGSLPAAMARAERGPLGPADARALARATGRELDPMMDAARAIREREHGSRVTYSANVFIPLTKLCRDVCHYCTFARPPRPGERAYMELDEVLEIARRGKEAGCSEALFTLGDKPELRYAQCRSELEALGCSSTLEYLGRAARAVLEQTGLLPHLNPGVMSSQEIAHLRRASASMGLMLEGTAPSLAEPGGPHHGSPDKDPARRIATIESAGHCGVPFTTGILIGIGETREDRLDALARIAAAHRRHGHIQEVIVQNFRAKAGTLMAGRPEPGRPELLWTIAAARLVLDPEISLQAPPNLSEEDFGELLEAGIDDWGGVSPLTWDHVNPEAPWPTLEALEAATAERGLDLAPRLTAYPRFVAEDERWFDEAVRPPVLAASDSLGLARRWRWHPGEGVDPPTGFPGRPGARRASGPVRRALDGLERGDEPGHAGVAALLRARGTDLVRVIAAADRLRREVCGDEVTYVVNRNINYTNVCYFRCGFCAFSKGRLADDLRGKPYLVPREEIVRRCEEAWERGATEVCLQGGIHPGFDGDYYRGIVEAIRERLPDLHIHAFSPLEVWQGAQTLGVGLAEYLASLRDAGLGTLPGTAAEVLDDDVREVICPDKIDTGQWLEVVATAHEVGLATTSTIMFGHVDGPASWARHLLRLRELAGRTGGITEFVPLPFVHMEAPIARRGAVRHGPTLEETVLMHAVARLVLHPHVSNVQASWVKLGPRGAGLALRAGANDLGGTLMNESISRAAGASHGQELPPERMDELISSIGRRPRQRTTLYGRPDPEQRRRSYGAETLAEPFNPPARKHAPPARRHLLRPGLAGSGNGREPQDEHETARSETR